AAGRWRMQWPMSTRLLQAKAQDTPGSLARLEQLATGGRAEVLEILGGAGVGGEDFEHRTRSERLQRAAGLEHRQRAEEPGRVEGGVHRHVVSLRHPVGLGRTKLVRDANGITSNQPLTGAFPAKARPLLQKPWR